MGDRRGAEWQIIQKGKRIIRQKTVESADCRDAGDATLTAIWCCRLLFFELDAAETHS